MNENKSVEMKSERLPVEAALDKVGFGLYGYLLTVLTGFGIISFACIAFSSMFIVPTSACELNTTTAQQGLLAAGPVVGLLVGGLAWGYLADTRGRRAMLLVSLSSASLANLIATISVNWVMLLIFQFIAAVLSSGTYSMMMSLLSESVPMAKRNYVVLIVSSIFLLSQGIMALFALPVIPLSFSYHISGLGIYWNSWRTLLLIYSLPTLVTALFVFLMYESPKFLFAKGNEEGALEVMRRIHGFGKNSKEEFYVKGLIKDETGAADGPLPAMDQIVPLFKRPLLKYTLIIFTLYVSQQISAFIVWLPTIANQFMRLVQSGGSTDLTVCLVLQEEIPANPDATPCALDETSLLIILGVAALHSVTNICISFLLSVVGRRNMAIAVIITCSACGILVNLVPNIYGSAVLLIIMTMGVVVIGLYTAITISLFPTHLRAMAIVLPMTASRVGTIAAIQILNLFLFTNCDVGFYLFSTIFLASAIAAFFLPDDRKSQVPPAAKDPQVEAGKNATSL